MGQKSNFCDTRFLYLKNSPNNKHRQILFAKQKTDLTLNTFFYSK